MIAVEEILSDDGLGGGSGGGTGGGGTGGGGTGGSGTPTPKVYITDIPNTPLTNLYGNLQIKCKTNTGKDVQASIYINEQSSGIITANKITLSYRDIFNNGDYVITVVGNGYQKSIEKYVITLVPNPAYDDNPVYTAKPYSESGKTNNLKIIGLSTFESLPSIDEQNPDYGSTNFYQFKVILYMSKFLIQNE